MIGPGLYRIANDQLAMVVTYLEMTAPPPERTAPVPDGLSLGLWPDPPLESYRALMRRVGKDWLWYARLALSDGELARQIHGPACEIACLWDGETPRGYAELLFKNDHAELKFFGVDEDLVGTGAARHLMADAIGRAWARPIKRFHLQTCTLDSPRALAFYRRSGFRECGRAVEITRDPRLSGLLPRDAAPNIAVLG